jgi:c-di-GMP-binding flagellar brake protein YcgR
MSNEQGGQKPQEFEFEAMNLQVGGRLQFITHRDIRPVQHFSTLIGYIKDEFMIVKIPMEQGGPIALTEGEKVTIRVFSGVTVCSFDCTVARVFARPLLYVHITFPNLIQGTSLRASMRVKVDIPAQVTGSSPAAAAHCTLINLSVTGALIESPRKLPPDDEIVTVEFTLMSQPGNQPIAVKTRASIKNVNVRKPSHDGFEVFTYGVHFLGLDPNHYTLLQNMTYEAMIADRQKIV